MQRKKAVKPNSPEPASHPDELLLSYAENMLAPDDKIKVEIHLSECEKCSSRARSLRDAITALTNAREIFCPEPWEIYEFVEDGRPEGTVSRHLDLCDTCRAEAAGFETAVAKPMPAELWKSIKEQFPKAAQVTQAASRPTANFIERLRRWFKFPTIAVATTAAAILVVLVLYPRQPIEPGLTLTSVTWKSALRPKAFQKTAVLIVLKHMKPPIPQSKIDSIYESLRPGPEVSARYSMVSPALLSAAIKNREIDADTEKRLLSGLQSKFNVSLAVLVDISRRGDSFDVQVNMQNAVSGKTLQKVMIRGVPDRFLNDKVREAVKDLLLRNK
jgi:Putative zinc-finger